MKLRGWTCALAAVPIAACSDSTAPSAPSAEPATPPYVSAATLPSAPHASADAVTGASETYPAPSAVGVPAASASDAFDVGPLRTKHVARLKSDRSAVTLVQGGAARDLGKRICEASAPKRPPETPVLLKPNLCGFHAMQDPAAHQGDDGVRGRITDPGFVRGVIDCLAARGHTQITVADGCAITNAQWKKLVALSGYEAMAKEAGVSLVALDDDGVFDVEGERPGKPIALKGVEATKVPELMLPKLVVEHLDHGLFLSLPKLKAHRFSVVSIGIKSMQGVVMRSDARPHHAQKWRMHRELLDYMKTRKTAEDRKAFVAALESFAERMVDVLEIATPDAVLAEGAPAEGGDGFEKLTPVVGAVAIGGTNPVLVDRIGAELLGLWDSDDLANGLRGHRTSPLIEAAATRFGLDLAKVETAGDATLLASKRPVHFVSIANFAFRR